MRQVTTEEDLNLVKCVAGVIKLMCVLQHGRILELKNKKTTHQHTRKTQNKQDKTRETPPKLPQKSLFANRLEGSG